MCLATATRPASCRVSLILADFDHAYFGRCHLLLHLEDEARVQPFLNNKLLWLLSGDYSSGPSPRRIWNGSLSTIWEISVENR